MTVARDVHRSRSGRDRRSRSGSRRSDRYFKVVGHAPGHATIDPGRSGLGSSERSSSAHRDQPYTEDRIRAIIQDEIRASMQAIIGESVALRRSEPQDPPVLTREESVAEPSQIPLWGIPTGWISTPRRTRRTFIEERDKFRHSGVRAGVALPGGRRPAPAAMDIVRPGIPKDVPHRKVWSDRLCLPPLHRRVALRSKKLPDELLFPGMGSIPLPLEPEKVAFEFYKTLEGLVGLQTLPTSGSDRIFPVSRRRLLTGVRQ